jgi:hypothetical protein
MNLCEKSEVSTNKYGLFSSLRKTMFFAGVKKDLFGGLLVPNAGLSSRRSSRTQDRPEGNLTHF